MKEIIIIVVCLIFLVGCSQLEFRKQVSDNTEQMKEMQNKEKQRQIIADIDIFCDSKCSKAHSSAKDKLSYCLSYYQPIDINQNGQIDFTTELDFINGYCEDRIYCAVYRPCGPLDLSGCLEIINGTREYEPGTCYDTLNQVDKAKHWYSKIANG